MQMPQGPQAHSPPLSIRRLRSWVFLWSQELRWGMTVQMSRSERSQSLMRHFLRCGCPLTLRVSSRRTSDHFCLSSKNLMKVLAQSRLTSQTRPAGVSFKNKNKLYSKIVHMISLPHPTKIQHIHIIKMVYKPKLLSTVKVL